MIQDANSVGLFGATRCGWFNFNEIGFESRLSVRACDRSMPYKLAYAVPPAAIAVNSMTSAYALIFHMRLRSYTARQMDKFF